MRPTAESKRHSSARTNRDLPQPVRAVPAFTVKFGSADPKALGAIADLTGGKLIEDKNDHLADAFKEIRGYQ